MWEEIKSVWYGLRELLEVPRFEEQTRLDWFISQCIIIALMGVIILFNFREFLMGWRGEKRNMFRECTVCRDGYDTTHLDYALVESFCPQCIKEITEPGLHLMIRFRDWANKQVDANGRSISSTDVKGIVLSVFYAIKNKAAREPLFDALTKYTSDNISDTVTLSELLEELSILQGKGNPDVHLEQPEDKKD